MHARLLALLLLLPNFAEAALGPVASPTPATTPTDPVSTNPTIQGGLPKVNPATFGELNFDKLPKGPDGRPIVATVNATPITLEAFQRSLKKAMGSASKVDTPAARGVQKALAAPALEEVLYEALYEEFAKKNGLQVSEGEVEARIRETNDKRPPGRKLQDDAYAAGRTLADIRHDVRVRLLTDKVEDFVGDQFTTGPITEEALRKFLLENPASTSTTVEIRAQHIVLRATPDMSPGDIDNARQRAEQILATLKAGEDFSQVARQTSQDRRTTKNGGDLGYFTAGKMFPEFERAAFALQPGQISEVVRTPVGFHIIKVTERNGNDARSAYWRHLRSQYVLQWRADLLKNAKVERFF